MAEKQLSQAAQWDHEFVWHPFTQMQDWLAQEPVVIERGEGVDVYKRQALASISISKVTRCVTMPRIIFTATWAVGSLFILQYLMPSIWGLGVFRAIAGFFMGFITPIANTLISKACLLYTSFCLPYRGLSIMKDAQKIALIASFLLRYPDEKWYTCLLYPSRCV